MMKAIVYLRVSTLAQGASGLGLEAQEAAVAGYLQGVEPLATYTEIESGKRDDRPELLKAVAHCQRSGAVLIVSKLDRLARSVRFLLALKDAGIPFKAADMPDANELTVGIMIHIAEAEAKAISDRTSRAIQAKIARGETWSRPDAGKALQGHQRAGAAASAKVRAEGANRRAACWRPLIDEMLAEGLGNTAMAKALNARGDLTAKGSRWTATAIRRLRARLDAMVPNATTAVGILALV